MDSAAMSGAVGGRCRGDTAGRCPADEAPGTPLAARRPHPVVAGAAAATPPARGRPTRADGADLGCADCRTARLLHVVLACDLTALLTVEADRLGAWLATWTADGRPLLRSARGGRVLGAAVA